MPIIREADAVPHRLHGATFHSFTAPASGSKELCAWRLEIAAGTPGQAHHVSQEEVLLLLTGQITVTLDGVPGTLAPGEAVLVPAGAEFCVDNLSAEPASAWVTTRVGLRATLPDGSTISPPWVR
ncbi:cupin domain-containing protein [Micromonosporaceae bacterium Da 78-11]